MDELEILLETRRAALWLQAMNGEQFWRPLVEARRASRPTAHMREALSLCQVKLDLLPFVDVEVDPDPIKDRSIISSKRLRPTEEPAVVAFAAANAKTHLSRTARTQTL